MSTTTTLIILDVISRDFSLIEVWLDEAAGCLPMEWSAEELAQRISDVIAELNWAYGQEARS